MRQFEVYLTGSTDERRHTGGTFASSPAERMRLQRQYRAFLPDASWLPCPPVFVWLTGPNGKILSRYRTQQEPGYELNLVVPQENGRSFKKMVAAAATAAAVLLPAAAQSASATPAGFRDSPPSIKSAQPRVTRDWGPPTAPLTTAPRISTSLQPLTDSRGRPVELGAFHSNTPTHTNQITTHQNNWANHSNSFTSHTNVWNNHSNIPGYTIPHTNVVPGNFIF